MIVTIRLPLDSGRAATCKLAHSAAPQEIPASRPSRRAQVHAVWIASSSETGITSSISSRLSTGGTKPAPMPWMRCGPGRSPRAPPSRAAPPPRSATRVLLAQIFTGAGDRATCADAGDEHVDAPIQRPRDLGTGRAAMGLGVGGIGELVGQEHVGVARHRLRRLHRLPHAAERLGDLDTRAVELEQDLALAAHSLRQRQHELVPLGGTHERERDAGVAARGLDDRAAPRLDPALGLGGLDHRHADPILDAAAWVERLELCVQLDAVLLRRSAFEHPLQAHQRRPTDKLRNVDRD